MSFLPLKATTFTCRFKSQAHPADLIKPAGYQVHSETSELLLLDKKDAKLTLLSLKAFHPFPVIIISLLSSSNLTEFPKKLLITYILLLWCIVIFVVVNLVIPFAIAAKIIT